MKRTPRFLALWLLATAIAPCAWRAARAQPFQDPGFGDPTTLESTPSNVNPFNPANPNQPGSYVPQAPAQPGMAVRPNGWPGGAALPVPGAPQPPAGPRVATALPGVSAAPAKKSPADPPYDPAEILARVGSERIQACEVLPMVNRAINKAVAGSAEFAQLPPEIRQSEIEKAQKSFIQQALKEMINTKLLLAEVRGNADKKALDENEKKIRDFFNKDYLAQLMKEYEASSVIELEDKLRALGGSIDSQRALFIEQSLASGWLNQAVKKEDREPTHDEMLAYYRAHIKDWETPARARWEQLTAKWSNFGSPQEARAAIARWGNDVVVRQRPFAEVARQHSQSFSADDGGVHDWASQGSLKSAAIDQALFTLPVGAMSRIIEDEEGCHIIRVREREEAKRTPFTDAQPEIRKQLHDGGINKRKLEYIQKLREQTPVWTVFDDEQQAAAPQP